MRYALLIANAEYRRQRIMALVTIRVLVAIGSRRIGRIQYTLTIVTHPSIITEAYRTLHAVSVASAPGEKV